MVLARPFEIGGAGLEGLRLALLPVDGNCSLQYVAEPWSLMHMKRNLAAGFDDQHRRFHIPFSGRKLSDGHLLKRVRWTPTWGWASVRSIQTFWEGLSSLPNFTSSQ